MQGVDRVLSQLRKEFLDAPADDRRAVFRRAIAVCAQILPAASADVAEICDTFIAQLAQFMDIDALRELAEVLARMDGAPKGVLQTLARGSYKVARPILERSEAIGDDILLSIAEAGSASCLISLAGRRNVSAGLSDIIVARGSRFAIVSLIDNPGATLSEATIQALLARCESDAVLQQAMRDRTDLPEAARVHLAMLSELAILETLQRVLMPVDRTHSDYVVPHQSTRLSALEELRLNILRRAVQ